MAARLLALGRALLTLLLTRAAARSRPATYEHDSAGYAVDTTSDAAWADVAERTR